AERMSPGTFTKWFCPMLGIEVFEERAGSKVLLVPLSDWRKLKVSDFQDWSTHPKFPKRNLKALSHIREMRNEDGGIIGRAALSPETSAAWVITGGMRIKPVSEFVGVFVGEPRSASRQECWVNAPEKELKRWADQQARLISKSYTPEDQMECSRPIDELGGSTKELFIARTVINSLAVPT